MPADPRFTVIILAAQREGRLDALAAEAGVTHKCLVPIAGKPLLAHVLAALAGIEGIESVRIAVEAGAEAGLRAIADGSGLPVHFTPAADNIADSVYVAADGASRPVVITTADNVLLTSNAIQAVAERLLAGEDCVVALARQEDVLAAHPEAQRNFYRLRDGGFSNCNLYGLSPRGLALAEAFRSGGQFSKNPMRVAKTVGLLNLLIFRAGLVTTEVAMKRIGRRFGIKASRILLDGAHAVDVDNRRTYDIAAMLLAKRAAEALSVTARVAISAAKG
jgi:GTP:adenosylcobinamide-phosphate guanylyltransferase